MYSHAWLIETSSLRDGFYYKHATPTESETA
jgi:hypothetical protein